MEILLIILVLALLLGVGVLVVDVFQPTFLERFGVKAKVSEKEEAYYALLDKILEDAEKEDKDSKVLTEFIQKVYDKLGIITNQVSVIPAAIYGEKAQSTQELTEAIEGLTLAVNVNSTNTKNTLERIEKSAKFSPTVFTAEQVDAIVKRAIETTVDMPINTEK